MVDRDQFQEPNLIYHVYIKDAVQFQKTHDTYDHWALFIVESGGFEYRLGEQMGNAVQGDMVLCPPDLPFHRATDGLSFHLIGFHWLTATNEVDLDPFTFPYTGKLRLMNNKRLVSTIAQLREANYLNTNLVLPYKNHLLRDLLYTLQIELFDQNLNQLYTEDPLLQLVVHKIKQNAEFGVSLKSIAYELGISQVQLTRLFKQEFRISPNTYATNLRMDKVKKLLINSSLTLEQISEHCGFTDEYHLSKSFKKQFGINPSAYRKAYQV